jgi:predicted ester cyclase
VAISSAEALIRRWVDVFNERDLDSCAAIGANAYVEHAVAPFGAVAPGAVEGPAHLRETAEWLLAQFPDMRMTILALVAERDLIAVRLRTEGTNLGPLYGVMPPTGRSFEAEQSHWFRVENGRLAEHWATRDDLSTMLQLGVIPRPMRPS